MAKSIDQGEPSSAEANGKALARAIDPERIEDHPRDSLIRKVRRLVAKHPRETLSVIRDWMQRDL